MWSQRAGQDVDSTVKANFVAKLTGLWNTWPSEEEACADKENKNLSGPQHFAHTGRGAQYLCEAAQFVLDSLEATGRN